MNRLLIKMAAVLAAGWVYAAQAQDFEIKGETAKPIRGETPASKPAAFSGLTFMDSKLFDAKLAKELDTGVNVVNVAMGGRITLTNIPPRMDRWLVKCAEVGTVEFLPVEQAPQARFIFSLISLAFSAMPFLKEMQEERMYAKIQNYDAKIYYRRVEGGDTVIDRMVLTKRPAK
jgi:hypothetical protein